MRRPDSDEFDYRCPSAYQEFVKAVTVYQKRLNSSRNVPNSLELNHDLEERKQLIARSSSLAWKLYACGNHVNQSKQSELEAAWGRAVDIKSNTALSWQQLTRLKQMGATVRNASSEESVARKLIGRMSIENISELRSFYHMMGKICSEELERKFHGIVNVLSP